MRAILLAPLPPPAGGIASWAKRMQVAELKNGWNVTVVDEKVIGGREIFGENAGKRSLWVEAKRCFNIWKNLWIGLNDADVKIVHSNIPAGLTGMLREIICALITKVRRKKFIIHYRCTVPNMVKSKIQTFVFKILTNLSDAVIALNTASEEFTNKHSKTKVVLIPNFVSFDEMQKEEKGLNADEFVVSYVGGVIPEKGCMDIIEAAKLLPDVKFSLAGAIGKDVMEIKAEVSDNVQFLGEQDKQGVQNVLMTSDVFVFASYFHGEGFSNALAEAMAAGLPCVVTDWAANADMIGKDGGIVVRINDPKGIADAVQTLKDNEELRLKMGAYNQQKVTTVYSQEVVTSQYVDLYESLLV